MVNDLRTRTDEELVRAAREGDPAAEEYLIEKYRGLAKEKSKTYFIMGADAEDVIQTLPTEETAQELYMLLKIQADRLDRFSELWTNERNA